MRIRLGAEERDERGRLCKGIDTILPGTLTAPPITMIDLALSNVCGDSAAARARLVSGPIAIIEIVSGGFSSRRRRISKCEGFCEGVKRGLEME